HDEHRWLPTGTKIAADRRPRFNREHTSLAHEDVPVEIPLSVIGETNVSLEVTAQILFVRDSRARGAFELFLRLAPSAAWASRVSARAPSAAVQRASARLRSSGALSSRALPSRALASAAGFAPQVLRVAVAVPTTGHRTQGRAQESRSQRDTI